jgi:tetratricopeptide (TPR) repeat protein
VSSTAVDNPLPVEEAVTLLTAVAEGHPDARAAWQEQMQRAATEYDERKAETLTQSLLEVLRHDHDDRNSLEAMLVLGLAHGRVLERHGATFANEGRRLALLLERSGDVDRARALLEELAQRMPGDANIDRDLTAVLRRTGGASVLVEKYLRRAEDAASRGRPMDAIVWLQEIVLIDKNRRDVARMIRDLRYQEKERKAVNTRRLRIAGLLVAIVGIVGLVWSRENRINEEYRNFPPAREGDLPSLQGRLATIERLIEDEHGWIGMLPVLKEKTRLEKEIELIEDQAQRSKREAEAARASLEEQAEDARTSGVAYAERGQFEAALSDFHRALELSTPDWEHRARVQADVDAIEAWRKEHR